jgi:hypothetical protein
MSFRWNGIRVDQYLRKKAASSQENLYLSAFYLNWPKLSPDILERDNLIAVGAGGEHDDFDFD